jgi:ClpP class serine protease
MNLMNVQGLEQKLGITANVVKSGQFKDMGSPNRPMTEAERELLQGLIMDSYNQFVEAVSKGRNLPLDTVKKLADGRIYTGRQAKDVKLVDELGGYEDALTYIREECKKKYRIKDDLPTDEGPTLDFINQLVQSGASFNGQTQGFNPLGQLFGTNEGIYAKQPLYLMQ